MITRELQTEIADRIASARRARCGGDEWVQPPVRWGIIVRESWPEIWSQDPSRCPDGWVDLLMAFSEHAMKLGGGLYHDAFENTLNGQLIIQAFYDDDRSLWLMEARRGYQSAALSICRVCGGKGELRQHPTKLTWALCDDHCDDHLDGESE